MSPQPQQIAVQAAADRGYWLSRTCRTVNRRGIQWTVLRNRMSQSLTSGSVGGLVGKPPGLPGGAYEHLMYQGILPQSYLPISSDIPVSSASCLGGKSDESRYIFLCDTLIQ